MKRSKLHTQNTKSSIVTMITIFFVLFAVNVDADEASNRALALQCKGQASTYTPWGDPQLETLCQQAAFDKCLAVNGITAYEQERVVACQSMQSSAEALGVNTGLCSSSCN